MAREVDGCYWERLSGLSGESADRIANDFVVTAQQVVVDIAPSDVAFDSSKCAPWTRVSDAGLVTIDSIGEGSWIVGTQLYPGQYRTVDAVDGCYWERQSGFGGESADRIANDFVSEGRPVVEIAQGDVGFQNSGCGTWLPLFEPPPQCDQKPVTIDMNTNGGNGIGTAGVDVILGTPGDDVIRGLGGDDIICAGSGRDRIYAGPGADTIYGGLDIDYIFGEDGDDALDGQGGSDRMYGGPGSDLMLGDSGADRMFGGAGDDEMRGMGGQDFMWGEEGNDLMQGNFQTDNMWGGPGDDTMFGAGGKDTLFGEAGNDSLSGGNNTDYLDGGADVDTANGGRGRDKPLTPPQIRASNGQLFGGSGCIAETIVNCQPAP